MREFVKGYIYSDLTTPGAFYSSKSKQGEDCYFVWTKEGSKNIPHLYINCREKRVQEQVVPDSLKLKAIILRRGKENCLLSQKSLKEALKSRA